MTRKRAGLSGRSNGGRIDGCQRLEQLRHRQARNGGNDGVIAQDDRERRNQKGSQKCGYTDGLQPAHVPSKSIFRVFLLDERKSLAAASLLQPADKPALLPCAGIADGLASWAA